MEWTETAVQKLPIRPIDAITQSRSLPATIHRRTLTLSKTFFPLCGVCLRYTHFSRINHFGLWQSTLTTSHTWFVPDKKTGEHQPGSWASLEEKTVPNEPDDRAILVFAAILRAETVPKDIDSTGEISSGVLVLQGRCLARELQYPPSTALRVSTIAVSCDPDSFIDIPTFCVDETFGRQGWFDITF